MKALVTGGCGFIGSNLVHRLSEDGWNIDIVDDLSNGFPGFLQGLKVRFVPNVAIAEKTLDDSRETINIFTMDFAHEDILSYVRQGKYDYIFHLAANPRVEYSVNNPTETTENNLLKTVGLFECAAKAGVKRVIFSSTCAVYGDAEDIPTREESKIQPNSPYGLQKYTAEMFAQMLSKTHNLESVCLRYFNVYGPRQFGGSPYSTAITAWSHNCFSGSSLRSDGDGTQSRDLIFVDDVVEANVKAALSDCKFHGSVYNIATGKSVTNNQILDLFRSQFGKIDVVDAPWRPGDVMHTLADTQKASTDLEFTSETDLVDGLQKTWRWWESVGSNEK